MRKAGIVLVVLALAGCAPANPAMSVDEAKRVTATFSDAAMLPPPQATPDVGAVLDQPDRENREGMERARARADASPSPDANAGTLAQFYFERGRAAGIVGRLGQQIDDYALAAAYSATASGLVPRAMILFRLAEAENRAGRRPAAAKHFEEASAAVGTGVARSLLIGINYHLVTSYTNDGYVEKAERALRVVKTVHEESRSWTGQAPADVAERDVLLALSEGHVHALRGRFREAERSYRDAIRLLEAYPVIIARTELYNVSLRALATTLVRQGRLVEAEIEVRRALAAIVRRYGRQAPFTGYTTELLGYVLLEQGRYAEAETAGRTAESIFRSVRSSPGGARRLVALALAAQERWSEALAIYDSFVLTWAGDRDVRRRFLTQPDLVIALLKAGRAAYAVDLLEPTVTESAQLRGERHALTTLYRALLGVAHVAAGNREAGRRELAAATPLLTDRQQEAADETGARVAHDHRLAFILGAFVGLLSDIYAGASSEDVAAEAFRLAEIGRGRSVERALEASAARAAASTPGLTDLVRREQDASMQLTAVHGQMANLLGLPSDQQDAAQLGLLRVRVAELQAARRAIGAEVAAKFQAYAQLVNPPPTTLAQARQSLRPGETMLATFVTPERTFVWAIPREGRAMFAAASLAERDLISMVAAVRKALDPRVQVLGDIPEFDLGTAHKLYRALLEPVRPAWQHARTVVIVPHGALGQLPFALLPTQPSALPPEGDALFSRYRRVPWLVRTHAVVVLPSAGALRTLRAAPTPAGERRPFVGFGDPLFSMEQQRRVAAAGDAPAVEVAIRNIGLQGQGARLAALPRLPDTAAEIVSIASALGADRDRDVFLRERANEKIVKSLDLTRYRVVAFATHGLLPGDLEGLTQPALALTAPEVAGVDGDGLLTMGKILSLRLDADWVVLSACNTSAGNGAGAEAISGLGRAFFYAGARALLVSNWPVETTSARALTTEVFRRQHADPRLTRARALQETMNAMIDGGVYTDAASGKVVFTYAHPIFWAPFTVVGDGGS